MRAAAASLEEPWAKVHCKNSAQALFLTAFLHGFFIRLQDETQRKVFFHFTDKKERYERYLWINSSVILYSTYGLVVTSFRKVQVFFLLFIGRTVVFKAPFPAEDILYYW